MKKIFIFIIFILTLPAISKADRIPTDKALQIAREFAEKNAPRKIMKQARSEEGPKLASLTDGHYVFNLGCDNGYVVVATDDMAKDAVLGYVSNGSFSENDMPDNLRWWLGEYDRQIAYMQQHKEAFAPNATTADADSENSSSSKYKEILPLLSTRWNQDYPYNMKCPVKNGKNCPTGCVATALGQIMYYNKWPLTGFGSYKGIDFTEYDFDWNIMANDYSSESSDESKDAVSTLMAALGNAVDMYYEPDASGTTNPNALNGIIRNFGYTEAMLISREELGDAWDKYLYYELSQNRPIYYVGSTSQSGGHAFVCDGFRNGFLHINWGWGGIANGYFRSTALNPPVQGIGGSEGYEFNYYQEIITNLYNPNDKSQRFLVATTDSSISIDKQETTTDGTLGLSGFISVMTNESGYYFGMRIVDGNGNESFIKENNPRNGTGSGKKEYAVSLEDFPKANGTYNIFPAIYGTDSQTWNDIMAESYSTTTSFTATVKDGTITFSPGATEKIEVSGVEIPDKMYIGEKNTIKAKVKCVSGQDFNKKLYIGFLEGDKPVLLQQENDAVCIFEGATMDVALEFTPNKEKGEYKVALFTITNGNEVQLSDYQDTHIVERTSALNVRGSLVIAGNNYTSVDPDNITIKAKVKCTVKDFNDEVRFVVYDSDNGEEICHISTTETLKMNESKTMTISGKLTGTEPGHTYYGQICHKDELDSWVVAESRKIGSKYENYVKFITADTSAISAILTETTNANAELYTADGRYVGKASEARNLPKGVYLVKTAGKWIKTSN